MSKVSPGTAPTADQSLTKEKATRGRLDENVGLSEAVFAGNWVNWRALLPSTLTSQRS
jgi:hypothetical protein